MSKALEAARRAIEAHPAYDCGSTGDEEMARAAITAYLSALAEDDETVERVAWAMVRSTEDPDNPIIVLGQRNKIQARAALSALTQEPKP